MFSHLPLGCTEKSMTADKWKYSCVHPRSSHKVGRDSTHFGTTIQNIHSKHPASYIKAGIADATSWQLTMH